MTTQYDDTFFDVGDRVELVNVDGRECFYRNKVGVRGEVVHDYSVVSLFLVECDNGTGNLYSPSQLKKLPKHAVSNTNSKTGDK